MNDDESRLPTLSPSGRKGAAIVKVLILVVVVGGAILAYLKFGDALTVDNLTSKETALRDYQNGNPLLIYGIAFAVYVAVTGLSLPGAAVLTLVAGWFFGFWRGGVLVSFASTSGATVAFLFSRFLLRDSIQKKFGDRLAKFNAALEKEGAFYLFSLRLIPAVPFFVINLVMGLTPIRSGTFWWVSQVGMLPGTAVFVYAGSQFPTLQKLAEQGAGGILTPQLIVAFIVLGTFPIVVKKLMAKYKPTSPTA